MSLFPFPRRGMDFDNDGAFMNEPVLDWCVGRGLEVTRSRAYHKNDQAWVEQKNGAHPAPPGRLRTAEGHAGGAVVRPSLCRRTAARQPVPAVLQGKRLLVRVAYPATLNTPHDNSPKYTSPRSTRRNYATN